MGFWELAKALPPGPHKNPFIARYVAGNGGEGLEQQVSKSLGADFLSKITSKGSKIVPFRNMLKTW
jgi:hypothetical protein